MAITSAFEEFLKSQIREIRESGLDKKERVLLSAQDAEVDTLDGPTINFCSNNYLGLANHADLIAAGIEGLQKYGYGIAAARFICGTQDIHRKLEREISNFLEMEEAILYPSCFDANGGLFEPLLGADDCIVSDELNHASIIDGIRLCKAQRRIYRHADMESLELELREAADARFRMIATDGVFSMDGDVAPLAKICSLAEKYDAIVMVDDSHATGLVGATGRGTPEHCSAVGQVGIITSTLGKALGGASGGFTAGKKEIIDLLRQRSRPYLFSNSLAPPVVIGASKALQLLKSNSDLVAKLQENTHYFREKMKTASFPLREGVHPIVPIMTYDERLTTKMAKLLNSRGVLVVGFSYPVVPKGQARIRVQISAVHSREQLDFAVQAFSEVREELGITA